MATKNKPTVEEKRDLARKAILDVSMELFFEKGFEKTTTRDIITKAGILNGSLYNRFKNKDEILTCIIKEAISAVLDKCRSILEADKNPIVATSFPGALEIYASSRSVRLASLLYEVHRKWSAVSVYMEINRDWRARFPDLYGNSSDSEVLTLKVLSSVGAVGNVIGYYANGGDIDARLAIKEHVIQVATNIGVPLMDVDSIVDRLIYIIENSEITFLGHNFSKELGDAFSD